MMTLRAITMADATLLYEWAMDSETRAQSFHREAFDWASHCRWLEGRLASPDWLGLVAEDGGRPVGMIRFDREGQAATLSFAVAPAARGQGYGTALLAAGAKYARAAGFVRRVCGYVKRTNQASLRCFEKAGFVRREDSQVNGVGCAAFEWPE